MDAARPEEQEEKSRQLSARNAVSNGRHMRGFTGWPGRVWVWS